MSKIVAPYPPGEVDWHYRPWPDAQWWRLRLRPNPNGHLMVMAHNADPAEELSTATWMSWEWFDGHQVIIDGGLDGPIVPAHTHQRGWVRYLDVLYRDKPTPADWQCLGFPHPQRHDLLCYAPPLTRVFV